MADRPKLLLVDDDQDLLDLYKEILTQLPSRPEIFASTNGPRALAMLDADPYTLLVCDLNMPKMDGLQVLSIVRRKFPELRTVVLTSIMDEQFRSRVYGLGVDLYWQKPGTGEEIKQFLDCIESLLGREAQRGGFRGVQSKSLVDIIQLECLSQSSLVLKIINGPLSGRIWIQNGEVIDAATEELSGEDAFRRILSWRAGNFESLAAEPEHPRAIFNSYQGLLLETAQAHDEAQGKKEGNTALTNKKSNSPLATIARHPGVEFILVLKPGADKKFEARGLDNPQPVADWSRHTLEQFRALGDRLRAGPLHELAGLGPQRHVSLAPYENRDFCVGWQHNLSVAQIPGIHEKALLLMGLLSLFTRAPAQLLPLPHGSFTVDREGRVLASTLPFSYPAAFAQDIAIEVLAVFRSAKAARLPLSELTIRYSSLKLTARELHGGAIIFLNPQTLSNKT